MLEELDREEDLGRSAELYRLLLDHVRNAVIATDLEGKIIYWNKYAEQLYQWTAEEVRGESIFSVTVPEDFGTLAHEIMEGIQRDGFWEGEFNVRRKDGSVFCAHVRDAVIADAEGRVRGYVGVSTDITGRKSIEAKLREQAEIIETVNRVGQTLAAELDQHRLVQAVTDAATEITGAQFGSFFYNVLDERGASYMLYTLSGAPAEAFAHFPMPRATDLFGPTFRGEGTIRIADVKLDARYGKNSPYYGMPEGHLPVTSYLAVPIVSRTGEVLGGLFFGHPEPGVFTERAERIVEGLAAQASVAMDNARLVGSAQRARARAEAAERRSAFLAQASAILASSLDYETTLATVSRLVVPEVADWCAVHVIGKDGSLQPLAVAHVDPSKVEMARELQHRYPLDPNEERGVTKAVRTGRSELFSDITDELLVEAARDPEQLHVLRELGMKSAMAVPMVVQGRALGAITFIAAESGRRYAPEDLALAEDLAHRAALAVDNARLYQDAQEANRVKDEFLATLSHELRTPLTAVIGWTQLLSSGQLDEDARARALQTIQRNARAQSQIIEDILDVSRIISGKLRIEPLPVEIVPVIEAAMDAVRPAAAAKAIQLQTSFDPEVNLVPCDPHRLQQVIWNLLSNAVKFTPPGGRVSVQLNRDEAAVRLTVQDTGPGISPEFLPYVFDRFRQADGSTTRLHGGLGLGLAIVRHLVELHGGSVKAESLGAGHGAAFTVSLPLTPSAQAPSADGAAGAEQIGAGGPGESGAPSLRGLRVLVVDDEPDTLDYVAATLRERGAEVTAASSVTEAMGALERLRPDVLVSDIAMPGEDGYELIRRVRQLEPARGGDVPAAALTAYATAGDRMRVLLSGFQIHLPKPVEPAELAAVVASLAGRTIKSS
jgi:PAS domain S-box-containing protein